MNLDSLKKIYSFNLSVKPTERVLVFTDRVTKKEKESISNEELERRNFLVDIAKAAAKTGREYAKEVAYVEYPSRGGHAIEPPEKLWRAAFGEKAINTLIREKILQDILKKKIDEKGLERAAVRKNAKKAVGAVIALSNYSTSHTIFRRLLTVHAGARYASMPLFDAAMLEGPMGVDYKEMKKRSRLVAAALKKAARIEVKAPNGTRISFERGNRIVEEDTGDLRRPGSFGNLPAGEVYLAPVEGTAQGKLVLEWAATRKLKRPLTLVIENGMVKLIRGNEPFVDELHARFESSPLNANIAELGIGTNDRAKRPDNILESEKILGTAHIALGDNSTFGGKTKAPFHHDFVLFKPTVTLFTKRGEKIILLNIGKLEV